MKNSENSVFTRFFGVFSRLLPKMPILGSGEMVKNGIIVEIFGLFVIYILASAVAVFIWWVANKTRITREAEAQQQQNDRVIQAQQQQLRVAIEKCSTARIIAGQS